MFTRQDYFLKFQFSWTDLRPILGFTDVVYQESNPNENHNDSFDSNSWVPVADTEN